MPAMSKPVPGLIHGPGKRCYFLEKVPTELRLRVYEFVYVDPISGRILSSQHYGAPSGDNFNDKKTALLRTCKTIYAEAAPFLYLDFKLRIGITLRKDPTYSYWEVPNDEDIRSKSFLRRIEHITASVGDVAMETIPNTIQHMKALTETLGDGENALKTACVDCIRFEPLKDSRVKDALKNACMKEIGTLKETEAQKVRAIALWNAFLKAVDEAVVFRYNAYHFNAETGRFEDDDPNSSEVMDVFAP